MPAVAILGPGGVGGFLAGAIARGGHDVTVVAREQTAEAIARDGLRVSSLRLGDFTARPEAATRLEDAVDVLIVATKAPALPAALDRIAAEPRLVVPLLNGIEHLALLRKRYGSRAVAASIRIESDRPQPGRIVQTSPFLRVDLASHDPAPHAGMRELARLLEDCGVPARIVDSEADLLWGKLVRLNALACTTAAADRPLGFIHTDPGWRAALEACVAEGVAVAQAEGATVTASAVMAELEDAHAELGSSLQRDVAAGREPELDHIAGAVLRAGERHGLACPTVARLAGEIARRAGVPAPSPA